MATYRIDRINKELLRLLSELLRSRIKNDEAHEAILTGVSVSRDVAFAKVYYTLIERGRLGTVQKALDAASVSLRAMLGKEMRLRVIPELRFIYDDTEERARKMDSLLDEVARLDAVKKSESEAEEV